MVDYDGGWHGERRRCHRFVYDEDGKPHRMPQESPLVRLVDRSTPEALLFDDVM